MIDPKITPSGQTIVKPTALDPVANTDSKLLIYGLFQKGRVLAQDGVSLPDKPGVDRVRHLGAEMVDERSVGAERPLQLEFDAEPVEFDAAHHVPSEIALPVVCLPTAARTC